jgi:hypothetical protein
MIYLKLYEEYFWQTSDNDKANKIIKILRNGIDPEKIEKVEDFDSTLYTYEIHLAPVDNGDLDPFGYEWEEEQEEPIKIEVSSTVTPGAPWYHHNLYLIKNNRKYQLKTNKAITIYGIIKKAYKKYKNEQRRREIEGIL